MHDIAITHTIVQCLADDISAQPKPDFDPLPCDSWIARSVMQKAIRREMPDLALRAAAQLFLIDRRTLRRRLLITALEDLGPGRLETTAKIVFGWSSVVSGSKGWPLVAELVRQSCAGTKSQVANDLWNIGLHHPATVGLLDQVDRASRSGLQRLYETQNSIEGRAAIMVAASEAISDGVELGIDDILAWKGVEGSELARLTYAHAHRLTRVPLALLMLLVPPPESLQVIASSDEIPPVTWNGAIPTFALDQYTRGGKAALRTAARTCREWHAFSDQQGLSDNQSTAAFAELVFRLDGAALTERGQYQEWLDLRASSMVLGSGLDPSSVHEGLAIIRAQLPTIDQIRGGAYIPQGAALLPH